jgi:MinD-like ATPase involved in chromosome partitioning or flagellar assembly
MVLPAPTDPARMERLDRAAYATVIERMQSMAGLLLLDCGTGLQEPAAQAAMMAADQFVLVSDAEPSTASLVAEASALLERVGTPITLVVNKLPSGGGRLDLAQLERRLPAARGMVTIAADPAQAARVAAGEFAWRDADGTWARALRELAVVLTADWARLGLAT